MSDQTEEEPLRVHLALAAIAGCASAAVLYALLRVAQAMLSPAPDPALVLWSEHSGFFWRAWTAAYTGGMIAFLVYVAARRDALRTARVVTWSIAVAATMIAAQGILVP
jgi:hypothetical protein